MDAILGTHSIDAVTMRRDDFEGFIAFRQKTLLAKIETVIGKAIVISDEAVPDDEIDEDESVSNGQSIELEDSGLLRVVSAMCIQCL